METCAECDKPIYPGQASYYSKGPLDCIGKTYHSGCGDPLGTKATARRIADLEAALAPFASAYRFVHGQSSWLRDNMFASMTLGGTTVQDFARAAELINPK